MLRQKKVAKEKSTPHHRHACGAIPCATPSRRAAAELAADTAQTVLAETPDTMALLGGIEGDGLDSFIAGFSQQMFNAYSGFVEQIFEVGQGHFWIGASVMLSLYCSKSVNSHQQFSGGNSTARELNMGKHECTIVIDTNQFCSDMMLSGLRWKRLVEYITKTDACLQMPQIVWQEIYRNYVKAVGSYYTGAVSAIDKLNHHIGFSSPKAEYRGRNFRMRDTRGVCTELVTEEIQELGRAYLAYIKATLTLQGKDFLETDSSSFSEIVDRAINHVKPFAEESDKGFKDTLLWKTILSLKDRPGFKDHPIVFVSSNSRDFGNQVEKGRLHQSLAKEAKAAGLDLYYFENLDTFLQDWAAEVFATDLKGIRDVISDSMIKAALRNHLKRWMPRNEGVDRNVFFTGVNFKIESAVAGNRVIRTSVSGYITNTNTPYPYLDFNAEVVYREDREIDRLTVETLSIPVEGLMRRMWTEEHEIEEVSQPFLELYGDSGPAL